MDQFRDVVIDKLDINHLVLGRNHLHEKVLDGHDAYRHDDGVEKTMPRERQFIGDQEAPYEHAEKEEHGADEQLNLALELRIAYRDAGVVGVVRWARFHQRRFQRVAV